LPGFAQNFDTLKEKGVDEIVCISVNDVFTLAAFAKHTNTVNKIKFLADGNAQFARSAHLFEDLTEKGLGYRVKRSAMLVKNGEIKYIGVEPSGERESSVNAILKELETSRE
jgi:glutaredoxin/glutathione-dependent peroxiredoxin